MNYSQESGAEYFLRNKKFLNCGDLLSPRFNSIQLFGFICLFFIILLDVCFASFLELSKNQSH
jgi:hypothetical protein